MKGFLLHLFAVVMPGLTWIICLFIPRRNRSLALRECKNKVEIMQLVEDVSSLTPPPGTYVPLPELVEKCYALGSFPALWAVEGMGHYYGDTFFERKEIPHGLLTQANVAALPAKSLTMLHAGIGLSLAQHSVAAFNSKQPSEIRKGLEQFVTLCRDSSREGYLGATIESLGLVIRFFHGPEMARMIDRELSNIDPSLVGYLWHGAGRATYFSPKNFIPGFRAPMRAIEMCEQEAPHEQGRFNMLAGVAWAITLVNMRHPSVMEGVLKYYGNRFSQNGAFSNGVASSLIMRYDTSPDDPYITPFCQYCPSVGDSALARSWNEQVKGPCELALHHYYPVLKKRNRLEEVFHYQPLGKLIEQLEKES